MSEYNIQMNKYNALNAEYDQLYPQPMKHASTHAKDGDDPITPSSIGAAELGADGKVLASQVDAYSKEESISAGTRTALSLPETATPDTALAEIARQLSESGGVYMKVLWENPSPTSSFAKQTLTIDLSEYDYVWISYYVSPDSGGLTQSQFGKVGEYIFVNFVSQIVFTRQGIPSKTGVWFDDGGQIALATAAYTTNNQVMVPLRIIGIKGVVKKLIN